jgi:CheY-like chemotaxis protein
MPRVLIAEDDHVIANAMATHLRRAGMDVEVAEDGDLGANILYRYENGILTSTPLWSKDGDFPHGAIVSGLNDVRGNSLFDLKNRLNINRNGCSFPGGYQGW